MRRPELREKECGITPRQKADENRENEQTQEDNGPEEILLTKDMAGPKADTEQGIKVHRTGKSQTINGMKTSEYEVITKDKTSIGWVADGQGDLVQAFKAAQESA